jgi:DNA invertase Pin-like site-specific DNA recombinase
MEVTAAAVYLRVSTDRCKRCRRKKHAPDDKCPRFEVEQDEANQRPDCAKLCAARGWSPVWFEEKESGAKERPEWRRALEAARRGEVGAVVFWAVDRTGRTRVQVAHDLSELFRWNVHVASVQDAWIDVGPGPARDLLVQVMAWVAEGERARLIERTKAGQARARLEGKTIGRPPKVGPGVVAAAREYREKWPRASLAAVAKHLERAGLGRFKRGTLWSALQDAGDRVPETGGQS